MRANREPQSKRLKSIADQQNEGQNHQSIERHPPIERIQIAVNGNKKDRSDERAEIELHARPKQQFFTNARTNG